MRKPYLDNIRWVTVILVLVFHVLYMYNAEGIMGTLGKITDLDVQYYDVYQYIVYPWFMMLSFIVSGICAKMSLDKKTAKEFLTGRTIRLLVPSTIGLFAFQFIQGWINTSFSEAGNAIMHSPAIIKYLVWVLSGTGVLWYMQLLWLFSLLLILIRKFEKDRLWCLCDKCNLVILILLTAVIWLFAQILNTPIVTVYRFGYYGISFFIGYFVLSHDRIIEILKKWFYPLLIVAVILGIIFCYKSFGLNYASEPLNRTPIYVAYAWFAALSILGGFARYFNFDTGFSRWMSEHSFGLYMFHYLGISAVALFIAKPCLLPAWACYLLSLMAGFAAGYGLYAIISRIPYYRWAVLGMKEKKDV